MRFTLLVLMIQLAGELASASVVPPMAIPRDASKRYLTDGIFDGGRAVRANLEGLRFSKHSKEGFERWVFDFSDATTGTVGSVAPKFQIRYMKASKIAQPEGGYLTVEPARIVITLKGVSKNHLTRAKLDNLAKKSDLVKELISYPPIEEGDIAIEMVLKDSWSFFSHQPLKNEGRLVIDLTRNS